MSCQELQGCREGVERMWKGCREDGCNTGGTSNSKGGSSEMEGIACKTEWEVDGGGMEIG